MANLVCSFTSSFGKSFRRLLIFVRAKASFRNGAAPDTADSHSPLTD